MAGTGLGIARGIEAGTRNFLDTYFAVKRQKEESKYRKLAPVMQTIYAQIQSEHTPLDEKIRAVNSIEPLLGIKFDEPLAQRLGLDKLAQQEIDTGETQTTNQQIGSAPARKLTMGLPPTPTGESVSGTTEVNLPAQAQYGTSTKKLLRKRGELSESDIETIKRKQLISAQQSDEFDRQYKLALLNAGLQERVLNKQGWKNNGDWTYDPETKSWQQEWFNPITKETYQQKLQPGVVPETVILKQIQYSGQGGGLSKAYTTLRSAIATSMGKNEDDPEVQLQTAKIWKNNFALGVINKQQDVEGTTPIQPNQKVNNSLQILQAQQKHSEFVAAAQSSLDNVNSLGSRKSAAWQAAADAKANFDKVKEDYDPEDKEYIQAENNWQGATKTANDLETEYQNALKSHNTAVELVKQSESNLKSAGIDVNTSPELQQFSPRMRVAIDAVRKANPNTKLTDAQIAERIRKEKGIQ